MQHCDNNIKMGLDMPFTKETALKVKHVISDLENLSCMFDSLAKSTTSNGNYLTYEAKCHKMKLLHISQFLDHVTLQFRNFLENKVFFPNEGSCNCVRCELFGYEHLQKLSDDVTMGVESIIEILDYLKKIGHFQQDSGCKVYISRFLYLCNYFVTNWTKITNDKSIFFHTDCSQFADLEINE